MIHDEDRELSSITDTKQLKAFLDKFSAEHHGQCFHQPPVIPFHHVEVDSTHTCVNIASAASCAAISCELEVHKDDSNTKKAMESRKHRTKSTR